MEEAIKNIQFLLSDLSAVDFVKYLQEYEGVEDIGEMSFLLLALIIVILVSSELGMIPLTIIKIIF